METRKLYCEDPRLIEFQARLVACEKSAKGWEVELDKTAFYPEGGGQPSDRGWIDGVPVLDVQQANGSVRHLVAARLAAAPGATLTGKLDWERRFDYMQQHTGQHLVSAAFLELLGVETVSVHLGESYTAVELDAAVLAEADLAAVEERVNAIIGENRPVRALFVPREEIDDALAGGGRGDETAGGRWRGGGGEAHGGGSGAFSEEDAPPRRYRLRKTPPDLPIVRLVEIEGFDLCACGGTHLARTGEAGLVRAVGSETIRRRVRVQWKIGRRAYRDYQEASELTAALARELGGRASESLERVRELLGTLKASRSLAARLEQRLAELTAATLPVERLRAADGSELERVAQLFSGESETFIRELSELLAAAPRRLVCLVNDTGERLDLSIATGSECRVEIAKLVEPLLPLVEGRGGGRQGRWRGSGVRREGASAFLAGLRDALQSAPGP